MKMGMYLIRDGKAAAFLSQPIMAATPGVAERQFVDLLQKEGFFRQHAGDFAMWQVGSLDDQTGLLLPCSPVEVLTGPMVLTLMKEV